MMTSQQNDPQTESLRIRFYRAYYGDTGNQRLYSVPIGKWLLSAGAMAFGGQPSRYHDTGKGQRIYTEVDELGPPVMLRINRTKYRGVPPAERHGNVDLSYLEPDEGLMDTWYAMVFDHNINDTQVTFIAMATKGNTSPNMMLQEYIKSKIRNEATQLRIEQLAHKDILERISNMGDGTMFEISVKPSMVETIRAVDDSLADALRASQTVYVQRELSQVIKPDNLGKYGLINRFRPVINLLLSNERHRTDVTRLRVGGMFGKSNRTTIINLLSNDLSVEVEVPYVDDTIALLDAPAVYNEIQEAYNSMADAIYEAVELSAWPEYSDGTNGTSFGPTQRQPPLFP